MRHDTYPPQNISAYIMQSNHHQIAMNFLFRHFPCGVLLLFLVNTTSAQDDIELFVEICPNSPIEVLLQEKNDDDTWTTLHTMAPSHAQHGVFANTLAIFRYPISTHATYRLQTRSPSNVYSVAYSWFLANLAYNGWCDGCAEAGENDAWPEELESSIWGYHNGETEAPTWAMRAFFSNPDDDYYGFKKSNHEILHKGLPNEIDPNDPQYLELTRVSASAMEDTFDEIVDEFEFTLDFDLYNDIVPQDLSGNDITTGLASSLQQLPNDGNNKTKVVLPLVRGDYDPSEAKKLQSTRKWLTRAAFTFKNNGMALNNEPIEFASGNGITTDNLSGGLDQQLTIAVPTRDAFFEYAQEIYYNSNTDGFLDAAFSTEDLDHKRPTLYGLIIDSQDPWDCFHWHQAWEKSKNLHGEMLTINYPEEVHRIRLFLNDLDDLEGHIQTNYNAEFDDNDTFLNMRQLFPGNGATSRRWGFLNAPGFVEYTTSRSGFEEGLFLPPTYQDYEDYTFSTLNQDGTTNEGISNFYANPYYNPTAGFPMWEPENCSDNFEGDQSEEIAIVRHNDLDFDCSSDYLKADRRYTDGSAGYFHYGGSHDINSADANLIVEWIPEKNPLGVRNYRMFTPGDVIGVEESEFASYVESQIDWVSQSMLIDELSVYTYQVDESQVRHPANEYRGNREAFAHVAMNLPFNLEWVTLNPAELSLTADLKFAGGDNLTWSFLDDGSDNEHQQNFSGSEFFPWALGPLPDITSDNDSWQNAPAQTVSDWLQSELRTYDMSNKIDIQTPTPTASGLGDVQFFFRDTLGGRYGTMHYGELDYLITQTEPASSSPLTLGSDFYGADADNIAVQLKIHDSPDVNSLSFQILSVPTTTALGMDNDNFLHVHNHWEFIATSSFPYLAIVHSQVPTFLWSIPVEKFFEMGFVPGATAQWDAIQLLASHRNSAYFQKDVSFQLPSLPVLELSESTETSSWLEINFDIQSIDFPTEYNDKIGFDIYQTDNTDTVLVFSSGNESISDLASFGFSPDFDMLEDQTGNFLVHTRGIGTWSNAPIRKNTTPFTGSIQQATGPALQPIAEENCMNVGVFVQWAFDPSNDTETPPISSSDWFIKLERRKVPRNGIGANTPWVLVDQGLTGLGYNDNLSSIEATTDWSVYMLEYRLVYRLETQDVFLPWQTSLVYPALVAPNQAAQLSLTSLEYSPSDGLAIHWDHVSGGDDDVTSWPTSIRSITIEQSNGGGWNEVAAQVVPVDLDHYDLDQNLSPCEPVSYRVISNGCEFNSSPSNSLDITIEPVGAASMWDAENSLSLTRDMGADVTASWTDDFGDLIDSYTVHRYSIESADDGSCPSWGTTDGLAMHPNREVSTTGFVDGHDFFGASPNQLYNYQISANFNENCNLAPVLSHEVVGFRIANGQVNGRITYEDGTASPGVTVTVTPFDGGMATGSLALGGDPSNGVSIPHPSSDEWSTGWWTTTNTDIDLLNVATIDVDDVAQISLLYKESYVPQDGTTIRMSQAGMIRPNGHTTWGDAPVALKDSLGDTDFIGVHFDNNNWFVVFDDTTLFAGSTFPGLLSAAPGEMQLLANNTDLTFEADEIRTYNVENADSLLLETRGVILDGIDSRLFSYYPCNERANNVLYDLSGSSNIALNARHGAVTGPCPWSNDGLVGGPVNRAVTDSAGYYQVSGIRYASEAPGDNIEFVVLPERGTDNFDPVDRKVTISDLAPSTYNTNFLNNSSYSAIVRVLNRDPSSGDVLATCGVEGAQILIDGEVVLGPTGSPILTKSDGESDPFQVPNGWHFISAAKDGHEFVIAEYAQSEGLNYAEDGDVYFYEEFRANGSIFNFIDLSSTFAKGRVLGGNLNAMLPWGASVNNIGQATFTLKAGSTSAERQGCPAYNVVTDVSTGEWSVHVPPIPYAVHEFTIPSAEANMPNWGVSDLKSWCSDMEINLPFDKGQNFTNLSLPDSIWTDSDPPSANPWYLPMVFMDDNPTIEVFNEFGGLEMGELVYQFTHDTAKYAVNMYEGFESIEEYPVMGQSEPMTPVLGIPFFVALRAYPIAIEWKEYYTNYDPISLDPNSAPIKYSYDVQDPSAVVTITDDLSYLTNQSPITIPWSPGSTIYTIQPSIGTNTGGDFSRGLSISIESQNHGTVSQWPSSGTAMQAYVAGRWTAEGETFTNAGPVVVEMILRDPPGDASYCAWNSETTLIKESFLDEENEFQEGGGSLSASIGPDIEFTVPFVGTGFTLEVENEISGEVGRFGRQTSEISISEMTRNETEIQTNDDGTNDGFAELSHHTADVFIGTSKAVAFSPSILLDFAPVQAAESNPNLTLIDGTDVLTATDKFGNNIQVQLSSTKGVNLNPLTENGMSSMFVFTNTHIESNVIPDIQLIRNSMIGDSTDSQARYRRLTYDELDAYITSQAAFYQGTFAIDVTSAATRDSMIQQFFNHFEEIQGWNNDDPRLMGYGIAPSTMDYWQDSYVGDDPENPVFLDRDGPVYKLIPDNSKANVSLPYATPEGTHLEDEVRDLNQSIRLWQEALAKNEMEKWLARKSLEGGIEDDDLFLPLSDPAADPNDFESYNLWTNGENDQPMILSLSGFTSFDFSTGSSETRREAHTIEYHFDTEMATEFGLEANDVGGGFGQSYAAEITTMRPTLTASQCEALQDLDNMPGPVLNAAVALAQPIIQTASVAVDAVEEVSQTVCDIGIGIQDGVVGAVNSMADLIEMGYTASGIGTSPELNYLVENGFYLETIAEANAGTLVGLTAATIDFGAQSVQAYAEGYVEGASYMVDLVSTYLPPGGVAELLNPFCYVDEIGDALDAFSNPADLPQLPWISECGNPSLNGEPTVAELAELMQAYGDQWGNYAHESLTENTFSFHIEDSDPIDSYLLAVLPGKGSNGPIFLNLAGESMCPWYSGLNSAYEEFYLYKDVMSFANSSELSQITTALGGTTLTEFMVDRYQARKAALVSNSSPPNTSLLIESPHLRHEVPSITVNGVSSYEVFGVESDDQAVLTLQLNNDSESGMDIIYDLRVDQSSNPDGAILMIDGLTVSNSYPIPYNGGIEKTLTINAGPVAFEHDSLALVFASQCQSDPTDYLVPEIADTAWVSVNFIPVCTDVVVDISGDQDHVINSFDVDEDGNPNLDFIISNFNLNYPRLETVKLQSKQSADQTWTTIHTWTESIDYIDDATQAVGNYSLFPTTTSNIIFEWDPTAAGGFGVGDGLIPTAEWTIRAVSVCQNNVQTASNSIPVELDLDPPSLFGLPEPTDGILGMGEAVSAAFNQALDPATIGGFSAMITGVLNPDPDENNYALSRFSSGYGIQSEGQHILLEDAPSLSQQDFAISMWFNLFNPSETAGNRVLVHQGPVESSKFELGINADNHLYVQFGDMAPIVKDAVDVPDSTWCYLGVSVDYDSQIAFKLLGAGIEEDLTPTPLPGEFGLSDADFDTDGFVFFGNRSDLTAPMNGVIREIRIWDYAMNEASLSIDRSTPLFSRTAGLRSWIPLRELDGTPGEWSRGLQVSAEGDWRSLPPGYSGDLTGDGAYLTVNGGDQSDDWTLELWVNGDASMQNGEFPIWTKGNWQNLNGQGLYWLHDATTDDYGIEFRSQGQTLSTVSQNIEPGEWNHIAISKKENGIVRFMVNGELHATVDAELCSSWTTLDLTIGGDTYGSSAFKGYVDELRLWHSARTPQQIQDHLRERLNFDLQVGLNLHVPFESASVHPNTGLVTSIPDSMAYHWNLVLEENVMAFEGAATFSMNAPLIELTPLPRELVGTSVTLNANQDELQFVLPENESWKIEDTRVNVALTDIIKDENGNPMSPGTEWDFFVRKNPLRWMEEGLYWETLPGTSMDTTLHLINMGGEYEIFSIERIPPWLTFDETEGFVEPLGTKEIHVTLSPGLAIGTFEWDVTLRGNMDYPERLNTTVSCAVPPPNFSTEGDGFAAMTSVIGHILVDGKISHHDEDFVVAYVNGEVRGVAQVSEFAGAESDFLVFLSIPHSFEEANNGEEVTFKIWDSSRGTLNSAVELLNADGSLTAWSSPSGGIMLNNDQTIYGSLMEPMQFSADDRIVQQTALSPGWNWLSFHVDSDSLNALQSTFPEANGVMVDEVKDHQGGFAAVQSNGQWLTNDGDMLPLTLTSRYLVHVTGEGYALNLQGRIPDLAACTEEVMQGWNGLGYPGFRSANLDLALSDLVYQNGVQPGDVLQSQTSGFAMLSPAGYWVGSLEAMEPGEGYRLFVESLDSPVSFEYPNAIVSSGGFFRGVEEQSHPWSGSIVTETKYVSPVLISCEVPGGIQVGDALAAFVNGKCIGAVGATAVEGLDNRFFLNLHHDAQDLGPVTFVLHRSGRATYAIAEETLKVTPNELHGTWADPFVLHFGFPDDGFDLNPIDATMGIFLMPNPTTGTARVVGFEPLEEISWHILDAKGKVVRGREKDVAGDGTISIDLSGELNGLYLMRILHKHGSSTLRIVKSN